jgi:hypothetical protein
MRGASPLHTDLIWFPLGIDLILGGNISRSPNIKMDYFRRIPLFQALTELEIYREVPAEVDAAARDQAGELLAL